MKKWIQFGALFSVTCVAFIAVLVFCAAMLRPETLSAPIQHPAAQVKAMETSRDTSFDSKNPPVVQRDVDYAEGKAGAWHPKGESPILAELVKEKKLPPVEERVGPEPLVLQGHEGVGKYGGTWNRVAGAASDISVITWRLSGSTLVRWSPMGYPIRPQIAKSWKMSPDRREYTFSLRKGMKWSDGHPFTADDIIYWWEEEQLKLNSSPPPFMLVEGKAGNIVKIDDYTVKFVFEKPNSVLLENLAKFTPVYAPKHYLAKYNPKSGDEKLIKATMSKRGFGTPQALYTDLIDFRNPEHPRLWPWIYRTYKSSPPENFVRNPYFCGVDSKGNQLPYVDRILFDVKNPKLIALAASNGDLTMQDRSISYDNYTLLAENRKRNGYQVYHWFPASRSAFTLWPNNNRRVLPNDSISRQKAVLLQDKHFRQALSLAINRMQVIKAIYNGHGEPAQIDPGRESEFHSEKLMKSFTKFDPGTASRMFDKLGLDKRDLEGMRKFPDGERMTWYIDFTDFTGEGPAQFVVDDWAAVGIRAIHRERSRPLFSTEKAALLHDFTIWTGESEFNPLVEPRSFVPTNSESHHAPATGVWYQKGGLFGNPAAKQGGIAPLAGGEMLRSQNLLTKVQQATSRAEQIKLFRQITDIAAEEVWSISIATPPPQLAVVRNDFHNVPRNVIYGASYNTPANAGMETFFFEKNRDSAGAIALIKREMTVVTPEPNAAPVPDPSAPATEGSGGLGKLISTLVYGIFGLGMVLAAVRHPYIGRRLLIMIPTMLLISVITFSIIQMPPGDFVQTKVMELKLTGDDNAIKEVERLSTMFHLDEPGWKQYSRWMGLPWFLSREEADKGLLQGNMGRSMETQKAVNDIVGDRILLTLLVSLGTILFTWAIALPIGIFSAVRQYTAGDYILTFLGFIGMCVPNFLLAILLMFWSKQYLGLNVTGLFSPEYAGAPEWSMGKVIDLLQHVWVPILVIATAGTAGMIRVMRGNLLDELRKPYVTTAMAKGVRPFRLLMKYPVRLALNPFISGIGAIFPQLVSGGAIVAIVLSLPMVGPVMLQGLMSQDLYLAGSMLMVLSLLGIFGTLVSDLLLLWLDPRIRMEGGSK
ncbi:MAG TPA: ABC transporter substrate-binding protein [Abditibacterium sp.]|jgi:ABC-type dipeptide/oligopeptide/nickel transport system permease component/ABC-type transport system substrate-binding protein